MITENVQNLFDFINFLHSNKDYLLSKQNLIDETNELLQTRKSIKPNDNYKSKIEYDKIQKRISEKFDIVDAEIIFPLKEKIIELNIADISTPIINLNAKSDLFELQRNFEEDDLKPIFEAKQKYLDFRNETKFDYYLECFFFELDRTLKEFYDFFKDDDFNEFSKLQTNFVTFESLDEQGIEKAVMQLISSRNELHFEKFSDFLDYLKNEVKDLDFDERHSEVKRMLEQQKIKLENSTFQSEIDEVKIFSENAVKDFKHKLMLSFKYENYKTKTVGFMPTHYNYVLGLIEYEKLYNSAKNKSDDISLPPQPVEIETKIQEKLTAKHYVLTYVFDCNAIGESLPHGNKKELERIGNERLGTGKGNTFYKNYNTIVGKDLNAEQTLIDEAGENWRNILLQLSKNPEALEKYLQSKQM
ncbi:hypothetical protein [Epilithonimonas hominis]|uniref:Uncharacterized protein n=1 Tax=Epilithonimonas hominis TaxID=420404 RepID=A0A1H6HVK5_9FLAO|nr:hypothetical protein [Epilithonimonas hominis]SEH39966.1 hypothetical protein SAMN05421793_102145 [Epilithonimonas hominis]